MATTSAVTTAITTALSSSGSMVNVPSVSASSQASNTDYYITGINSSNISNGNIRRELFSGTTAPSFRSNRLTAYNLIAESRIGIGTYNPSYPLEINNGIAVTTAPYMNNQYYLRDGGSTVGSGKLPAADNNATYQISLKTSNSIWVCGTYIWLTSDQRIKTNIVNLNADKMMNILRNLRPISFNFIDHVKNGNKKKLGFIAQEINEILPEGITLNTDVIPNNMMKCEIDLTSKIEASFTLKPDDTDITLQYLLLTTESPLKFDTANPYSSTDTYKFKVYCGDKWAKEQDIYIRSEYNVIDDKYSYVIGMKKDVYDIMITEPTLFVYGQYVYDLHILDHDTIYTVATAALQEVDRQQQADKARIAELEATVANQQSLINDILERLKTLEKA